MTKTIELTEDEEEALSTAIISKMMDCDDEEVEESLNSVRKKLQ